MSLTDQAIRATRDVTKRYRHRKNSRIAPASWQPFSWASTHDGVLLLLL